MNVRWQSRHDLLLFHTMLELFTNPVLPRKSDLSLKKQNDRIDNVSRLPLDMLVSKGVNIFSLEFFLEHIVQFCIGTGQW